MPQAMVNFRMDKDLKINMEQTCKDMGLSMTTAFTIFANKVTKEKRIPFDVAVEPDLFYSGTKKTLLKQGDAEQHKEKSKMSKDKALHIFHKYAGSLKRDIDVKEELMEALDERFGNLT